VSHKEALEDTPMMRGMKRGAASFVSLFVLLASARASAQDNAPPSAGYPPPAQGQPPPGQYPPPGYPPPRQYPPPGYPPPPTAYAPPGWAPAPPKPPHPRRVFSLTISPLHLILTVVELTGEARVHDKVGLAVIGGAGKFRDSLVGVSATVIEAGAQVRYYVVGDFRHGMQLGAELLYLHLDFSDSVATGEALAIGPFIGYKVIADAGFTFDVQLGFEHASVRDSSGSPSNRDLKYIPLLNLNIGRSF
jgi:hypothetical protein